MTTTKVINTEEAGELLKTMYEQTSDVKINRWFTPTQSQHILVHELGIKHYHSGKMAIKIPTQEVLIG